MFFLDQKRVLNVFFGVIMKIHVPNHMKPQNLPNFPDFGRFQHIEAFFQKMAPEA